METPQLAHILLELHLSGVGLLGMSTPQPREALNSVWYNVVNIFKILCFLFWFDFFGLLLVTPMHLTYELCR